MNSMKRYHHVSILVALSISLQACASTGENTHPQAFEAGLPYASPTVNAPPKPAEVPDYYVVEWQSRFDGIKYDWTGKDLFIQTQDGRKKGVFSRIAGKDYSTNSKLHNIRRCEYNYYIGPPSSVVGSIVSFEYEYGIICGAVPGSDWGYGSLDVAKAGDFIFNITGAPRKNKRVKNGKTVRLTELFAEDDILSGLLATDEIRMDVAKAISDGKISMPPQTLREFDKYFTNHDYEKFGGFLFFESDYLSRFVFHHLESGKVAVWISLTPTTGSSRSSNRKHLQILLPIPPELSQSLHLADSREKGFLMKDAEEIVGTKAATFSFGLGD